MGSPTNPAKKSPPKRGVGETATAVGSGGGVGGFLAIVFSDLPETHPLKPYLIFLAPTISATITASWPRVYRWFSVYFAKRALIKKLDSIISSPTASADKKKEAKQIKENLEWNDIKRDLEIVMGKAED